MDNARLRKNYKCNEEVDYYNRVGHNCYDDNSSIITTILIGIAVIAFIYLIFFLIKILKKKRKKKLEEKELEENTEGKEEKK